LSSFFTRYWKLRKYL